MAVQTKGIGEAVSAMMPKISMTQIISWLMWGGIIIGIIVAIIIVAIFIYRKKTYKFPVTIFSERCEGQSGNQTNEFKDRGAFLRRKGAGVPYFRLLKRKKELIELPVLKGISQTNEIFFFQKDMDTYIQLIPHIDEGVYKFVPIDSDLKYGAILDIKKIHDIVQRENMFVKFAPWFGLIILFVAALVFLNILAKKVDPAQLQQVAQLVKEAAEALARAKGV